VRLLEPVLFSRSAGRRQRWGWEGIPRRLSIWVATLLVRRRPFEATHPGAAKVGSGDLRACRHLPHGRRRRRPLIGSRP
jgi:hypothetical protein